MPALQKLDISSRTIFRIVLILAGFWFVYLIRDVLLMLFGAVVVAAAIEPLADKMQRRRIPRAVTVAVVYVVVLLLFAGAVTLLVPALTEQLTQVAATLPQLVSSLKEWRIFSATAGDQATIQAVQNLLFRAGNSVANISLNVFEQTRNIFSGLFTTLFVFIIAFYLVVERDALTVLFRLIMPKEHFPYVERTLIRVRRGLGRWMAGQLVLALIMGTAVGVGLWLLGVPYALLLGLLAGLFEIIPVIGPIIAAVPGVFIAFSHSPVLGIMALVFYILIQQAENHLLVPTVMRRTAGLNPLVTLIAILLGARLAGIVGVILAVPMAIIVTIFWADFFSTESATEEQERR